MNRNWTLLFRPKDIIKICIERLDISIALSSMSFVFTQNISYELKLAVNVPDTVYDELTMILKGHCMTLQ